MLVRRAKTSDIPFFLKLKEVINKDDPKKGFLMGLSLQNYFDFISDEIVYVLIDDEKDGDVVGFAIGISNSGIKKTPLSGNSFNNIVLDDSAYFSTLAILPEIKYRRYAPKLAMTVLLELFTSSNKIYTLALVSPIKNLSPLSLWNRIGFEKVGIFDDNHPVFGDVKALLSELTKNKFRLKLEKINSALLKKNFDMSYSQIEKYIEMKNRKKVVSLNREFNLNDFKSILLRNSEVELDFETKSKVKDCHSFLDNFKDEKIIYGINTGFGPMAQYKLSDKEIVELQYNCIRTHATGIGAPVHKDTSRAILLTRLVALSRGYSGVDISVIETMTKMLNRDIVPVIYEHGGVGASGDLTQLSHLALALIGEGEVWKNSEIVDTDKLDETDDFKKINVNLREGLSLINGTSAMTGLGLINLLQMKKGISLTLLASAWINEIMMSYSDAFSVRYNAIKNHSGQIKVAKILTNLLSSSKRMRVREELLYNQNIGNGHIKHKVQEYYSLRCIPQIMGPIIDTFTNSEKVLINELNSVNDNPMIDPESMSALHGGNFHGDYVSLEMDKLRITIAKMTMLVERQLNYILNDKVNECLPPFLNMGKLGFNYGIQGLQFPATSSTAENQVLATPMYTHSIPNNNDNQDIVSMGFNSAKLTQKAMNNFFGVISIQLIALANATDILEIENDLSDSSKEIYTLVRKFVAQVNDKDRATYKEIQNLSSFLSDLKSNIPEII